jgi:hypothetical protein
MTLHCRVEFSLSIDMGRTMLEVQKIYYSIEEDVKNCFVVCVEEA